MNELSLGLYLFIIYAFLGWVVEVVYHAVSMGIVTNRGFLNGPVCPIYGFGMIMILYLLMPVSDSLPALFIGGMILTTMLELFGGWALEKLFHMRWWDYSKEPFNLKGYICPKFSLAWGLGVVFAVRVMHAIVMKVGRFVLGTHLKLLLIPAALFFVIDLAATVATILKLEDDLKRLDKLAHEMREFSDSLTEKIGTDALERKQRMDESRVQAELFKAEYRDYREERRQEIERELQERRMRIEEIHNRLHKHKIYGPGRLVAAYPHMMFIPTGRSLGEAVRLPEDDNQGI